MKTTLLVLLAVVMVGCSKKNPPKPENFTLSPNPDAPASPSVAEHDQWQESNDKAVEEWEKANKATTEWFNSLVVCLHCGSDLKAKGAKVCPECLRNQRE